MKQALLSLLYTTPTDATITLFSGRVLGRLKPYASVIRICKFFVTIRI